MGMTSGGKTVLAILARFASGTTTVLGKSLGDYACTFSKSASPEYAQIMVDGYFKGLVISSNSFTIAPF